MSPIQGLALRWVLYLAVIAGAFAWVHHKGDQSGYARGHAEALEIQHRWDLDRQATAQAAITAAAQNAALTDQRIAAQKEIDRESYVQVQRQASDRAAADLSHRRLLAAARQAAAASAPSSGHGIHPSALAGDSLAAGACGVLTDVLGRLDDAAGEIANYADGLRTSLDATRAEYQSLTPTDAPRP